MRRVLACVRPVGSLERLETVTRNARKCVTASKGTKAWRLLERIVYGIVIKHLDAKGSAS